MHTIHLTKENSLSIIRARMTQFYGYVLFLGAIAGFTIYIGLPIARLQPPARIRALLNAVSIGVLLFLFVEIAYQLMESVEESLKLSALHLGSSQDTLWNIFLFVGAFSVSIFSLVLFELRFLRRKEKAAGGSNPRRVALMIAIGIGLHNFSEGLVIGQSFVSGALSLGYLLVIGFALHNATEGFGIAGPLTGQEPSVRYLGLMGLIGGGPTFLGTLLGVSVHSPDLEILFQALAAGSILYVIGELMHLGRMKGEHLWATTGLVTGFFIAFASELAIESAMMKDFEKVDLAHTVSLSMEGYSFVPNHFSISSSSVTKVVVQNKADVDHEIEIIGMGKGIEAVVPAGGSTAILLHPRGPGRVAMICDMPGHLARGMFGTIDVLP